MYLAIIVFCAILADVITGLVKAWANKSIDSKVLRKGLLHKFSELFLVGLAYGAEFAGQYVNLDISIPLYTAASGYVILMEIISVFENLIEINPDLGKFLGRYLKNNNENKEDKEND